MSSGLLFITQYMATKNITIQKQKDKYYLHIDTNSATITYPKDNLNDKCIDVELSQKELNELKLEHNAYKICPNK